MESEETSGESHYIPDMGADFIRFASYLWPIFQKEFISYRLLGQDKQRRWRSYWTSTGFANLVQNNPKAQAMICARWTAFILQSIEADLSHEAQATPIDGFYFPLTATQEQFLDALIRTRTRRAKLRLKAQRSKAGEADD